MINKEQMVHDLRVAGVEKGDTVLIHSALSAIGYVDGGADAVIDAFIEAVGSEGTVAHIAMHGIHPFDAETSVVNVGVIGEVLRKRQGAYRSLRPTHSVAAIGKRAKEFTADHEKAETNCGEGTPFTKIRDWGGKIVLIGVDMNRNTTLHGVEDVMDCTYLVDKEFPAPTYMKGVETVLIKKFPPGHREFLRFTEVLRRNDAMTEGRLGNAQVKVIDAAKMYELGCEEIKKDHFYFLCNNDKCKYCTGAR